MRNHVICLLATAILTLALAGPALCNFKHAGRQNMLRGQIKALADKKSPFENLVIYIEGGQTLTFPAGSRFVCDKKISCLVVFDEGIKGAPQHVIPFERIVATILDTEAETTE